MAATANGVIAAWATGERCEQAFGVLHGMEGSCFISITTTLAAMHALPDNCLLL
jgi:hypothetical protein